MNQPTIRVSPSDLPKFSFLQYRNYLGEFKTEIDKARVRYNLGIPDSLSLKWGNIGGTIENQPDLIQLVQQSINDKYSPISSSIETLTNKVNVIGDNILNLNNEKDNIQIFNNRYKQELEQRLLEIEREVSQNASLIKLINNDGTVVDLSSINSAINSLRERITVLENQDNSKISTLENNILSLQSSISLLQSEINSLKGQIGIDTLLRIEATPNIVTSTVNGDKQPIIVTAIYDSGRTVNVTPDFVTSGNTTIATWNNGIEFNGVGNTTLVFSYSNKTVEISVTVTGSEQIPIQYVGYAPSWSQVLGNQLFATTTVAKTWTQSNTPSIEAPSMGFYIVTTQNISTITNVFPYAVNDTWIRSENYNGNTYNIYRLGPVTSTDNTITITI